MVRDGRGIVPLSVPQNCTFHVDRLPLAGGAEHARIAIRKPASWGTLGITVRLR